MMSASLEREQRSLCANTMETLALRRNQNGQCNGPLLPGWQSVLAGRIDPHILPVRKVDTFKLTQYGI